MLSCAGHSAEESSFRMAGSFGLQGSCLPWGQWVCFCRHRRAPSCNKEMQETSCSLLCTLCRKHCPAILCLRPDLSWQLTSQQSLCHRGSHTDVRRACVRHAPLNLRAISSGNASWQSRLGRVVPQASIKEVTPDSLVEILSHLGLTEAQKENIYQQASRSSVGNDYQGPIDDAQVFYHMLTPC